MADWRKPSNAFDAPGFTLFTRSLAGRVSLRTVGVTVTGQSKETHIRPMTERDSLEANLKKRFQAGTSHKGVFLAISLTSLSPNRPCSCGFPESPVRCYPPSFLRFRALLYFFGSVAARFPPDFFRRSAAQSAGVDCGPFG